ncbi:hypothetical protein [Streptomyces hygroscopicus]|uniref:hypothetical protein n=1 Tax=Streptomyces hygroscopicus TaxID=1912 RepID=UPI000767B5FA
MCAGSADLPRVHVLHHGRLAEHGSHNEFMAAQGRYAAMFAAQAAQYARTDTIPRPGSPTVTDPA